jgi:transposase
MQLDPEYYDRLPSLRSRAGLDTLDTYPSPGGSLIQNERAAAVRRLGATRLRLTLAQAEELARQIAAYAEDGFAPLARLCGVNLLTAGILAGIVGPGRRFSTDAELAACAGAAPLEASSAGSTRHRLNRGGNRRLNAILFRIVLTQAHCSPAAKEYLQRRMSEGKTRREAVRALKRYIIRAIWRLWQDCQAMSVESAAEHAA